MAPSVSGKIVQTGRLCVLGLFALTLLVALTPRAAWGAGKITDNMMPTANWNKTCFDTTIFHGVNCQTDNESVGWRAEGSIDFTSNASDTPAEHWINITMANSYNGTDLNTYFDTTPVYSGSGETDVVYRAKAGDFDGTKYIGMTWCDDAVSALRCDQQYVQFKDAYDTDRYLACHETGHSVGLLHGQNASPALDHYDRRLNCMVQDRIDTELKYLDDNNVANINDTYPNT